MSLAVLALSLVAAGQTTPYGALGTEPFWSLTIDDTTIRYQPAEGQSITVAKPRALTGSNGERYQTPALAVRIAHSRCSDGMSDRTYRDTVTIRVGDSVLKGCGGGILSESDRPTMVEGAWTITAIDGRPTLRGTKPSITFHRARLQGQTGCNRFSGGFDFTGGKLRAKPLATTRRGCVGKGIAAQENTLLTILGQRFSVSRNAAGKLVMTTTDRRTLLLTPER